MTRASPGALNAISASVATDTQAFIRKPVTPPAPDTSFIGPSRLPDFCNEGAKSGAHHKMTYPDIGSPSLGSLQNAARLGIADEAVRVFLK